jgi:hypothetical protein
MRILKVVVHAVCIVSVVTRLTNTALAESPNGSVIIARPVPKVEILEPSVQKLFPFIAPIAQSIIHIDRKTGEVSLMEDGRTTAKFTSDGAKNLNPGSFKLIHKQRHPLWQAPADYFRKRNLPVPPEGSSARLLKGALGDFALFINEKTPIHSGATWSEDVGGIKLSDSSLAQLYYRVEVGTSIVIE